MTRPAQPPGSPRNMACGPLFKWAPSTGALPELYEAGSHSRPSKVANARYFGCERADHAEVSAPSKLRRRRGEAIPRGCGGVLR